MTWTTQALPEFKAISSRVAFPMVFRTIDFKFEGAGILRDIGRVHPSGVRDFLGCFLGVKGEFDPHFISPIKPAGRSLVAEVEAVTHSRA